MELGPIPTTDGTCATWRSTYWEKGVVRAWENRFCCGADDFYVNEGGGVKLTSRWIGDVLVSPFKREVVTGPRPLRKRGIQRIE
jgi:hypothetical protein